MVHTTCVPNNIQMDSDCDSVTYIFNENIINLTCCPYNLLGHSNT